jgi:hypothetical protein
VEPSSSRAWSIGSTLVAAADQLFFMGLFFLIAGYFTPSAYARKGAGRFVWDRCIRLGIPLLVTLVVISPYLELVKSASLGHPTGGYWNEVRWRLRGGALSPGPLWFVEALLGFSCLYAVMRALVERWGLARPGTAHASWGSAKLVAVVSAIALASFGLRLFFPVGHETAHLQLGFFGQYGVLFAAGVWTGRRNGFTSLNGLHLRVWAPLAVVALLSLVALAAIRGGLSPEAASRLTGGLHWEAALAAVLESIYCVGVVVTLLVTFRDHIPTTGLTRLFAADAYAVYVIHAPVLVTITASLHRWQAFPPAKAVVAATTAVVVCFATSHLLLRRSAWVRRVL